MGRSRRHEKTILRDIGRCYNALSPENLYCDGEATQGQASRAKAALESELKVLFNELGREVSEDELYPTRGRA